MICMSVGVDYGSSESHIRLKGGFEGGNNVP